ncbi:unnamed protein product [Echinostoma caproni]|uniref:Transposase n=1 Tax=Echinostoma caproni TaxID=27848 RepID=A0A183BG81_9TREM|nr:unnamed protein product [Echinostoma caproni]
MVSGSSRLSEFWLAQVKLANVTNQLAKFAQLVGHIPTSVAPGLRDIVCKPPSDRLYDELREAILGRFGAVALGAHDQAHRRFGLAGMIVGTVTPQQVALHREATHPNRKTDNPTGPGDDRVRLAINKSPVLRHRPTYRNTLPS